MPNLPQKKAHSMSGQMQQVEDRTSKSREHVEQPGVVCEHTQSPCELHYNLTPSY